MPAYEILGLSAFTRRVVAARARLALDDPGGEADAVSPLSTYQARWILLTLEIEDALRRRPAPSIRPITGTDLETGRDLLSRLGADPDRGRGVIRCPAHEDHLPSLSWRLADDGRALLHCFAGCTFEQLLEAVA